MRWPVEPYDTESDIDESGYPEPPKNLEDMGIREWRTFRAWLLELDRKHSGRQGTIWAEIVKTFKLFE